MPLVSRVGVDAAGGTILGMGGVGFTVDGATIAVVGDAVAGHGIAPHSAPVMANGQGAFRVNGIAVCRAGNTATCGHAASGSSGFSVA